MLCAVLDWRFDLNGCGAPTNGAVYDYSGRRTRPADGKIYTETDLPRLRQGGVDAQFFSIYPRRTFIDRKIADGGGAAHRTLDLIDALRQQIQTHSEQMALARTADDVRRIAREGKLAALLGIEGGHAIENSLGVLRQFHALGVRYMTLTHANTHDWADSSGDVNDPTVRHHGGLTDFGREVVREMNRLGMMVDVSHVSDKTFYDALAATCAPVIASHSGCRALANHPRNLTDDMLRALGQQGGIIMINFHSEFLDPRAADFHAATARREKELQREFANEPAKVQAGLQKFRAENHPPRTPLAALADQIDHAVRVAGIEHVGLGSDFDGEIEPPEGLEDVSKFPNLTTELLRRDYTERQIKLILGENLLRVMREVERVAQHSE